MTAAADRLAPDTGDKVATVKRAKAFVPLDLETRAGIPTADAAHHLLKQPQTLRGWACHEDGPIHPRRINGLLVWPTDRIRELLGVAAGISPRTLPLKTSAPDVPAQPQRPRGRPSTQAREPKAAA